MEMLTRDAGEGGPGAKRCFDFPPAIEAGQTANNIKKSFKERQPVVSSKSH